VLVIGLRFSRLQAKVLIVIAERFGALTQRMLVMMCVLMINMLAGDAIVLVVEEGHYHVEDALITSAIQEIQKGMLIVMTSLTLVLVLIICLIAFG